MSDAGKVNGEDKGREAILKKRAEVLARKGSAAGSGEEKADLYLVFARQGEWYAVSISCVQKVQPLRELAPLPGAPPYLSGITNVEGYTMPVVDLMAALGTPSKGVPEHSQIVVIKTSGAGFALLADTARGVEAVSVSRRADQEEQGIRGFSFVSGISLEGILMIDAELLAVDPDLFGRDPGRKRTLAVSAEEGSEA